MKAAIVDKPGRLVVRKVPDPVPGDYDALCELLYGSTCTGTDTHIIRGDFPFPIIDYPAILGHESVGRVVRVGGKVRNYRVGDLVTRVGAPPTPDGSISVAWGGYAEYGLARDHWAMKADGFPESDWAASRVNQVIPPSVDPRAAPMFTTWRETFSYLTRMGISQGTRLLVIGSGGNGLSYVAHGVNLGAYVWLVGAARCSQLASRLGANGFIDYTRADCAEALQTSCPEGFDIIIDAVGKVGQADRFLPSLKPGGKIGIYGIDDFNRITITPRLGRGSFTLWNGGYDEAESHQRVSEFFLQAKLDASIWYDLNRPWPLDRIGEAFQAVWDRKAVKALIQLRE